MGFNIVDLITSQLGGGTLNKLAGSLGLEPDQTQKAVGAAVPSLLAGLMGVASTPDGAKRLSDTVSRQDTGILDNFGSMIGGQATSLSQSGSSMLGSLLGGNTLSGLVGGLSKFTGVGQGGLTSLLGMLAPLIMGMLGRQQKTMGLDASGLASMLAGQKNNILGAMPAGLGSILGSVPGLGSITDSLRGAGDVARDASRGAADTARDAYQGASETARDAYRGAADTGRDVHRSTAGVARETAYQTRQATPAIARWLLPLAAVLALGALLYMFLPRRATVPTVPAMSGSLTPAVSADVSRVSTGVKDAVDTLTRTLGDVKDAASAQAALPKLQDVNTRLGSLKSVWDGLPASARTSLNSVIGSANTTLKSLFDKVNAIPGVGDKLKPVLDEILGRFTAMQ